MEVHTIDISKMSKIPSGNARDGIRLRRSGFSKILWRKLDKDIPASIVLPDGVNRYTE